MNRRSLLAVLATGASGGCLFGDAGDGTPSTATERSPTTSTDAIRPTSNPDPAPAIGGCQDSSSVRLRAPASEVVWGDADGLALRVSDLSVEFGDSVAVALTNTSDETVSTSTKYQYNVEVYTDDGWQEVRVSRGGTPQSYDDIAITHEPGEGFTWEFTIREDGLAGAPVHDSSIETCPDLEPGRYRFVYWGATGSTYPAVAFDVSSSE